MEDASRSLHLVFKGTRVCWTNPSTTFHRNSLARRSAVRRLVFHSFGDSILDIKRLEHGREVHTYNGIGGTLNLSGQITDMTGLEVSPVMAAAAAARVPGARIIIKDGLSPDAIQDEKFDLVTAFRFFLNTSDEARRLALANMHRWLAPRHGRLICNIHGNSSSLRHFALTHSTQPGFKNELSDRYMRSLLREAGFTIVATRGFGLFPEVMYRTLLRPLVGSIDSFAAAKLPFTPISIDIVYIAVAN